MLFLALYRKQAGEESLIAKVLPVVENAHSFLLGSIYAASGAPN